MIRNLLFVSLLFVLGGCALLPLAQSSKTAPLTVATLRCNYLVAPLGIDSARPCLGWVLQSGVRGQCQTAYQILVASTPEQLAQDQGDLWDSGKVVSGDSVQVEYGGRPLSSRQVCFWKVRVWDRHGVPSRWSAGSQWSVGLFKPEDWQAVWLNDGKPLPGKDEDFYAIDPAPLFRKEFQLSKPVKRASLQISGLGYCEASLNGARIGDQQLDPGWTLYSKRVLYSTYDLTPSLRRGANCLGVTLGNGWYNPLPLRMWGHLNLRQHLPVGRPRFIARLDVEFLDGSHQTIVSDAGWKVADGPIRRNSVYLGELYDARQEQPGWDRPDFDDSAWRPAAVAAEPIGELRAQECQPIRRTERLPALRLTEPRPGVFIYDFGVNFSGWVDLRLRAPAGTSVGLRYGELLNRDGTLNPLTSACGQIKGGRGGPGAPPIAWQGDTYIAKGRGLEAYAPRFTFHAFRYLEITGLPTALPLQDVIGWRLNSAVPAAGTFACSNPAFNEIQQLCRRTFLANLFSVQSDCPHRERFGYGGDIAATSEAFICNFDMATFYAKTVHDRSDGPLSGPGGIMADTAPFVGIQYCGFAWQMAHPWLVSQSYRYYGNRRLLEEEYANAKAWLALVTQQHPGGLIEDGLGDHEAIIPTSALTINTPLYCQTARMLATWARQLQKPEDARQFEELAGRIQTAWRAKCLQPDTGQVGKGTQTSQACALYADVVAAPDRAKVMGYLLENLQSARAGHLTTGILGTKFLLDSLSANGQAETAYAIVNQPDFPGWRWMLKNGATTLWEHWALEENTFSHNHPMFGSVSQWFFQWLGGIQPAPDAVGFDRILIRPQPVKDLEWVRCTYDSIRGPIVSNWQRRGAALTLEVTIPANATATVHVPAASAAAVTESGKPAAEADGVKFLRMEANAAVYAVGSGTYRFESTLTKTAK